MNVESIIKDNEKMIGKRVFGYGGITGMTPCIYVDGGHFDGTRTDEVDYRSVKGEVLLEHLTFGMIDEMLLVHPSPYGYRTQGGATALYDVSENVLSSLIEKNTQIQSEEERKNKKLEDELNKRRGDEQNRLKLIRQSIKEFVCTPYSDTDEGGKVTSYTITVVCHGGKTFKFVDRNIFDFGRVVSPQYKIADNLEVGGLATTQDGKMRWQDFDESKGGWYTVREMTEDESVAYAAAVNLGGHSRSYIRM